MQQVIHGELNQPFVEEIHQDSFNFVLAKDRNFQLANSCFMCQSNSESVNHQILYCAVGTDLWCVFILLLDWTGLCRSLLEKPMCAGIHRKLIKTPKRFGLWHLLAFFGVFGWRQIADVLMGISTSGCLVLFSWVILSPENSTDHFLEFVSSRLRGSLAMKIVKSNFCFRSGKMILENWSCIWP